MQLRFTLTRWLLLQNDNSWCYDARSTTSLKVNYNLPPRRKSLEEKPTNRLLPAVQVNMLPLCTGRIHQTTKTTYLRQVKGDREERREPPQLDTMGTVVECHGICSYAQYYITRTCFIAVVSVLSLESVGQWLDTNPALIRHIFLRIDFLCRIVQYFKCMRVQKPYCAFIKSNPKARKSCHNMREDKFI